MPQARPSVSAHKYSTQRADTSHLPTTHSDTQYGDGPAASSEIREENPRRNRRDAIAAACRGETDLMQRERRLELAKKHASGDAVLVHIEQQFRITVDL